MSDRNAEKSKLFTPESVAKSHVAIAQTVATFLRSSEQ